MRSLMAQMVRLTMLELMIAVFDIGAVVAYTRYKLDARVNLLQGRIRARRHRDPDRNR